MFPLLILVFRSTFHLHILKRPSLCVKMAARNRRAPVPVIPDVDNTIDLVQVDGLVREQFCFIVKHRIYV